MSSSFFLKGKSKKPMKRKGEKLKKFKSKRAAQPTPNLENGNESSESDLELKKFSDVEESESDHETTEEKKLRLAKKYLEEIEKEELKRTEHKEVDKQVLEKRLKLDFLEQQGRLRVRLADKYAPPSETDCSFIRCKQHRLPVTCLCVSNNGLHLFTGSKCSSIVKWSIKDKTKLASITHKVTNTIKGSITCIAISTDGKYLASSDQSPDVHIWDPVTLKHIHTFKGHKDTVTGLVFRKDTHSLYSASKDRSVKIWSLDEMAYVETLFGHQAAITSIDTLSRERAVTAGGRDSTVRIWKIVEESQLIFNGPAGSLDQVKLLDEEHFVSGSDNGSISVWSVLKKKPLCTVTEAHGSENEVPRWIISLAAAINSDVFASGSHDNNIRLWKVCESYRSIEPLFSIVVNGFVNEMQFSEGGRCLHAAVGQEHKAGRWWRDKTAKNGILVVQLSLSDIR